MEITFEEYRISDDKDLLDRSFIHRYLSEESHWARGIPYEIVDKSISNSISFGLFHRGNQVGFGRVITDSATFGYLADVFIIEEYRGKGLSLKLVDFILTHPNLSTLRSFVLGTKDAHGLYEKFGWTKLDVDMRDRFMRKVVSKPYLEQ